VFVCLIQKDFSAELVHKISKVIFKERMPNDPFHEFAAGRYGKD
jgi:hypothetical protein